ncbi:MAG TPA: hypothetical protein VHH55_05995 [Gaiellaceae bacterium]|nr:hypothetical protein [Gaiellaceae bacterium]
MDTVLGLIGMLVYIVCTIALAAGVTWAIVKVSPSQRPPKDRPAEPKPS